MLSRQKYPLKVRKFELLSCEIPWFTHANQAWGSSSILASSRSKGWPQARWSPFPKVICHWEQGWRWSRLFITQPWGHGDGLQYLFLQQFVEAEPWHGRASDQGLGPSPAPHPLVSTFFCSTLQSCNCFTRLSHETQHGGTKLPSITLLEHSTAYYYMGPLSWAKYGIFDGTGLGLGLQFDIYSAHEGENNALLEYCEHD